MSRRNLVASLVCSTCVLLFFYLEQLRGAKAVEFTKTWSTDFKNKPEIVKFNDEYLAVVVHKNLINLTSIDGIQKYACKFSIPPNRTVGLLSHPMVLGNGKLVVHVWAMDSNWIPGSKDPIGLWDLFIIFDPHDCSSTMTIEKDTNSIRYELQQVIPYHDTFDLFYREHTNRRVPSGRTSLGPRRYNDKGKRIAMIGYLLGPEQAMVDMKIGSLKRNDAFEGYFLANLRGDQKTLLLRYLDSNFREPREIKVLPRLSAFSFDESDVKDSLCYSQFEKVPNNQDSAQREKKWVLKCDFFDRKYPDQQTTVKLSDQPESHFDKSRFSVSILPDDSRVVLLEFKVSHLNGSYNYEYYLQRVYNNGTTDNERLLVATYTNDRAGQMRLVSLGEGEVCVIFMNKLETSYNVMLSILASLSDDITNVKGKCIKMLS
ncbi:hypothetical protein TSAR_011685 [Trichomalopsis sarcophagae]|uniref:Uncharacterized protein n=1 Tax=Trichomalopsis sarcophagae TaxID=543379 RepID=A0A232EKM9_9HYME|nr:hypothetical protein TSAR_011685 [Trichomalopsis sarcophagae]